MTEQPKMKMSHKLGLGSLSVLVAIAQIKVLVGTQEKALVRIEAQQVAGFAELKQVLRDHVKIEREDAAASEVRCEKRADSIEARVLNLERVSKEN